MRKNLLLAAAVSLIACGCATTQSENPEAAMAVEGERPERVTGTNLPTRPGKEPVQRVKVIDREDIEESGATDLTDVLNRTVIFRRF